MRPSKARYDLTLRLFLPLIAVAGILWWFIAAANIFIIIFSAITLLGAIKLFFLRPNTDTRTPTLKQISLLLLCQLFFYGLAFLMLVTTRHILPMPTEINPIPFQSLKLYSLFPWPAWILLTIAYLHLQRNSTDDFFPNLSRQLFPKRSVPWQQSLSISMHYYLQQTNALWLGCTFGLLVLGVTYLISQTLGFKLPWDLRFDTMLFASLWMLLFASKAWQRSVRWSVSHSVPSGLLFLALCLFLLFVSLAVAPLLQLIPIELPRLDILPQTDWLMRWDLLMNFWWIAALPSATVFTAMICRNWSYKMIILIGSVIPILLALLNFLWPLDSLHLNNISYYCFVILVLGILFIALCISQPWRHMLFRHIGECKKDRVPITQHRGMLQLIAVVFSCYLLTNVPGTSLFLMVIVLPFTIILMSLALCNMSTPSA